MPVYLFVSFSRSFVRLLVRGSPDFNVTQVTRINNSDTVQSRSLSIDGWESNKLWSDQFGSNWFYFSTEWINVSMYQTRNPHNYGISLYLFPYSNSRSSRSYLILYCRSFATCFFFSIFLSSLCKKKLYQIDSLVAPQCLVFLFDLLLVYNYCRRQCLLLLLLICFFFQTNTCIMCFENLFPDICTVLSKLVVISVFFASIFFLSHYFPFSAISIARKKMIYVQFQSLSIEMLNGWRIYFVLARFFFMWMRLKMS